VGWHGLYRGSRQVFLEATVASPVLENLGQRLPTRAQAQALTSLLKLV